jgi:hypothetical protein
MELALNTAGIAIDCYEQVGDGGKDDFWILQSVPPLINTGISMRSHTRKCNISLSHATWKNNSRRYSTADGSWHLWQSPSWTMSSNLIIHKFTNRKNSHKGHMYEP